MSTEPIFIEVGAVFDMLQELKLAIKILEQVRAQPDIRPINIQKDLQSMHGLVVPYSRVHAAKEHALKLIHGTHEDSYAKIPKFCEELLAANPGSFIEFEATPTNQFHRLFLCFYASMKGFENCKPLLGIDGTHLKSKYKGILLTTTATDAQGQLFPLAFGVVDAENDENWLWFLRKLYHALMQHVSQLFDAPNALTILSDRQKGLLEGVENVFPLAAHGYCLKHLEHNLKSRHNHPESVKLP